MTQDQITEILGSAPTGRGVQSVEVAGRILAVLADSTRPMMLRDVADNLGLVQGLHPDTAGGQGSPHWTEDG